MNWGGPAEFLAMGGYGLYVWGSFGVTALCIAVEIAMQSSRARQSEQLAQQDSKAYAEGEA